MARGSKKSGVESTKGRQKIANCEKERQRGNEEAGWREGEKEVKKRKRSARTPGWRTTKDIFTVFTLLSPVITICAPSDAAHSFCDRCARGCCISLHRESNRFVRFCLISVYRGSTRVRELRAKQLLAGRSREDVSRVLNIINKSLARERSFIRKTARRGINCDL